MAKRKNAQEAAPTPAELNSMFFGALADMAAENGIDIATLSDIVKLGVEKAIKRDNPRCDYIRVEIDPENNVLEMGIMKQVVDDEPLDEYNEINIEEARTIDSDCYVGGMCLMSISPAAFGRVAVQNAKQQIKTELKSHERARLIEQFNDKLGECVTAKVERIESRTGNAVLSMDKSEVYLVHQEQIPGEVLTPGDMIKVYVVDITNPEKKPTLKISRTHKNLVKRLFEKEVPEIEDGAVEVMAISRVAGSRSKIAVRSKDPNVDAVGACIGPRKSRISAVVNELRGEKIDIIPYSDSIEEFIARALAPAQVIKVIISTEPDVRACRVVVAANQLSLAIGNKGQNARLAAGLTGYKIDIVSDIQEKEREAAEAAAKASEAEADGEIAEAAEAVNADETAEAAENAEAPETAETAEAAEVSEAAEAHEDEDNGAE